MFRAQTINSLILAMRTNPSTTVLASSVRLQPSMVVSHLFRVQPRVMNATELQRQLELLDNITVCCSGMLMNLDGKPLRILSHSPKSGDTHLMQLQVRKVLLNVLINAHIDYV